MKLDILAKVFSKFDEGEWIRIIEEIGELREYLMSQKTTEWTNIIKTLILLGEHGFILKKDIISENEKILQERKNRNLKEKIQSHKTFVFEGNEKNVKNNIEMMEIKGEKEEKEDKIKFLKKIIEEKKIMAKSELIIYFNNKYNKNGTAVYPYLKELLVDKRFYEQRIDRKNYIKIRD